MADPLTTPDDAVRALQLVLDHACEHLVDIREPVRERQADEAARSFRGSLPDEGNGTLPAIRQLLEHGTHAHVRSGGPRFFTGSSEARRPAALAADWFTVLIDQRGRLGHEPACARARGGFALLAAGALRAAPGLGRCSDDWRHDRELRSACCGAPMVGRAARVDIATDGLAGLPRYQSLQAATFTASSLQGARHAWCRAEAGHVLLADELVASTSGVSREN